MVSKALDQLNANTMLGQLIRYAITGGAVTLIGAAAYWALVTFTPIDPLRSVFIAYVICVVIGYVLHSRWSFRGHGSRDNPGRTTTKFFVVSLVSYVLNTSFTWGLTHGLHLPDWTPVIPMLFVTPFATFALNRRWVFG